MNVRLHTQHEHKHGSRIADVVRITLKTRPDYVDSVQTVIKAQARNAGVGMDILR